MTTESHKLIFQFQVTEPEARNWRGIKRNSIKLLEESIGKTFSDINCTYVFLGQCPKAKEIKTKINKRDLIKLRSFCTAKEPFKKKKKPIYRIEENICKWCSQSVSSVAQSCPTLCDPMNRSMPGLPVHHQRPEFTQTHVHPVSDAIQPSHPLSSPFPPAPNPTQHQSLCQWVNSSHEVAKVLDAIDRA